MVAAYRTLELQFDSNGIVTLSLNRPDCLNALNATMRDEIAAALEEVTRTAGRQSRVLVVRGNGRAFCSGGDIGAFVDMFLESPSQAEAEMRKFSAIPSLFMKLPVPTLACVHGAAVGGGLGLAAMCDLRIASDEATFALIFVHRALTLDFGTSYTVPRLIGFGRAMEMSMLGEPISARRAEEFGLVNWVVPQQQLEERTYDIALRLTRGAYQAQRVAKRMLYQSAGPADAQLEAETMGQTFAFSTQDFREAVDAFLEKRRPQFAGR